MSHASIPSNLWDHVFQSVIFLINRLPTSSSPHISPFTRLFKQAPIYTFFRVIGCRCFPLLRPYNSHKLDFRSLPCVFLGYCQMQKGYKCLHLPTNKIYVSRNVKFDEHIFPFASPASLPSNSQHEVSSPTSLPLLFPTVHQSPAAPSLISTGPHPLFTHASAQPPTTSADRPPSSFPSTSAQLAPTAPPIPSTRPTPSPRPVSPSPVQRPSTSILTPAEPVREPPVPPITPFLVQHHSDAPSSSLNQHHMLT